MLVPPVQQDKRLLRRTGGGSPVAEEKPDAVRGGEVALNLSLDIRLNFVGRKVSHEIRFHRLYLLKRVPGALILINRAAVTY